MKFKIPVDKNKNICAPIILLGLLSAIISSKDFCLTNKPKIKPKYGYLLDKLCHWFLKTIIMLNLVPNKEDRRLKIIISPPTADTNARKISQLFQVKKNFPQRSFT